MRLRRRILSETGLKSIEITPLIDCVFLLLIFFMLTSNFIISPGINIKLPKAETSQIINSKNLTLLVSAEDIIYFKGQPVTEKELKDYLTKNKPESIFIKSDKDASLGTIISIWDICKSIGIEKIGIATLSNQ